MEGYCLLVYHHLVAGEICGSLTEHDYKDMRLQTEEAVIILERGNIYGKRNVNLEKTQPQNSCLFIIQNYASVSLNFHWYFEPPRVVKSLGIYSEGNSLTEQNVMWRYH